MQNGHTDRTIGQANVLIRGWRRQAWALGMLGVLLYSLSAAAGPPVTQVQLNSAQQPGQIIDAVSFSPDGQTFCFIADLVQDDIDNLYCTSATAPAPATPVHNLANFDVVHTLEFDELTFSANSQHIYFQSNTAVYRTHIDSGDTVRMSAPESAISFLDNWFVDETAGYLVYAPVSVSNETHLFAVPLDAPGQVLPLTQSPLGGFFQIDLVTIAPGAQRLVFRGRIGNGDLDLYVTTLPGGALQAINQVADVDDFALAPDGSTVVYRANGRLYAVPLTGGSNVEVSEPTLVNFGVSLPYFITADSSSVLYVGDEDGNGTPQLKQGTISGSGIPAVLANLSTVFIPEYPLELSSNGEQAIYMTFLGPPFPNLQNLRTLSTTPGGVPVDIPDSNNLDSFRYWRGLEVLTYVVDTTTTRTIYHAGLDGSGFSTLVTLPEDLAPRILDYSASSDRFVYVRQLEAGSSATQLVSVERDGTGTQALSTGTASPFFDGVGNSDLSADGRHLNYVSYTSLPNVISGETTKTSTLIRVAVETGLSSTLATVSHIAGQTPTADINFLMASPVDPGTLIYLADMTFDNRPDVFMVQVNDDVFADSFE